MKRRARSILIVLGVLAATFAATGALAWVGRGWILARVGGFLASEDALAPADMVVISIACERDGALEAAALYREGISRQVVLFSWLHVTTEADIASWKLGVPRCQTSTEAAEMILRLSGVPESAILRLTEEVDGTGSEVRAVARLVRERKATSLLFLTLRNHTARARWLLERELPAGVRLAVRSPRLDEYDPATWWRTREGSRDVLNEYLHWGSALLPVDPWS